MRAPIRALIYSSQGKRPHKRQTRNTCGCDRCWSCIKFREQRAIYLANLRNYKFSFRAIHASYGEIVAACKYSFAPGSGRRWISSYGRITPC